MSKTREKQLNLFSSDVTVDQVLDEISPDELRDSRTWPSFLAELIDVIADNIETRWELDQETATSKALDIAVIIGHHLGGRSVYLPRDDRLKRAVRDSAIFRAFDGSNHLALAKETGLTTTQIYNIIAKQRSLRYDKQHMKLPFPE